MVRAGQLCAGVQSLLILCAIFSKEEILRFFKVDLTVRTFVKR